MPSVAAVTDAAEIIIVRTAGPKRDFIFFTFDCNNALLNVYRPETG
jgi:hypothetical protein